VPLQTTVLEGAPPGALDLDLLPDGRWVALTRDGPRTRLHFAERTLDLAGAASHVRALPDGRLLVVAGRAGPAEANARVLSAAGAVEAAFHVGDDVVRVAVAGERVLLGYGDEGTSGRPGPACEFLTVYALTGEQVLGYASRFGPEESGVECYAAAWLDDGRAAALAYPGFALLLVDVDAGTREVVATPKELHEARALSVRGDDLYFATRDHRVARWRPGQKRVEKLGKARDLRRGLPGGRFLAGGKRPALVCVGDH